MPEPYAYHVCFQIFKEGETIPRIGITQPLKIEFEGGQWLATGDIYTGRGEMLNAAVLDWLAQRIGLHQEIISGGEIPSTT